MAKDVSILVLSWNTRDYLRECLASIPASVGDLDTETIVIDNASADGSADMVAAEFPWVHLVRNTENVGYARGNNQAYALCSGETALLLNSDIVLPPGGINAMEQALRSRPQVGMVIPRYTYPDGSLQREMYGHLPCLRYWIRTWTGVARFVPGRLRGSEAPLIDLTCDGHMEFGATSCALVRRTAITAAGELFDERFPLLGNDADLSKRLLDAGWIISYQSQIVVRHYKSKSVEQVVRPWRAETFLSVLRYFAKHKGILHALALWTAVFADTCIFLLSSLRSAFRGHPCTETLGAGLRWRCSALFLGWWCPRHLRRSSVPGS